MSIKDTVTSWRRTTTHMHVPLAPAYSASFKDGRTRGLKEALKCGLQKGLSKGASKGATWS